MELFDIPESKSPRLKWMERNHITVKAITDESNKKTTHFAYHGMKYICQGENEMDCLYLAAERLKIKLWNEE